MHIDSQLAATAAAIATCLALLSTPAAAMDSQRYENARFGYMLDVPTDFTETGDYGVGRGKTYIAGPGVSVSVFGAEDGAFEDAFAWLVAEKETQGFGLESTTSTPTWASYTGRSVSRVAQLRAVATCAGTALAVMEVFYPTARRAELEPVVERLTQSLRATDAAC